MARRDRFAIAWATLLPVVLRRDFGCSLGAIGAASALDMDCVALTGDPWSALRIDQSRPSLGASELGAGGDLAERAFSIAHFRHLPRRASA